MADDLDLVANKMLNRGRAVRTCKSQLSALSRKSRQKLQTELRQETQERFKSRQLERKILMYKSN